MRADISPSGLPLPISASMSSPDRISNECSTLGSSGRGWTGVSAKPDGVQSCLVKDDVARRLFAGPCSSLPPFISMAMSSFESTAQHSGPSAFLLCVHASKCLLSVGDCQATLLSRESRSVAVMRFARHSLTLHSIAMRTPAGSSSTPRATTSRGIAISWPRRTIELRDDET